MRLNWKRIALLATSLFGSFFLTLWLTEPPEPVFRPEMLKALAGTSNSDLLGKLFASGFKVSSDIKGNVDEFARRPDNSVRIVGWAADLAGDGSPLTVSVYSEGKLRLSVDTNGTRDDVTHALDLPSMLAANVAFTGTLMCAKSATALVLAINPADGRYARLDPPLQCP